ncbi:uncharacterized protein CDAR_251781 [Caerostris darwini]|uniref:Gustatory receptor n=1 Tax=Caerostris darwini TaxID=1538125 RepID=A0AAV4U2K3_9ARAC|nr:uncharacterized protein CDAR_251781 [Caerostris darwini]
MKRAQASQCSSQSLRHFKHNIPLFLYTFICCTGLTTKSDTSRWYNGTFVIFCMILLSVNIDYWIQVSVNLYVIEDILAYAAYALIYALSTVAWYAVRSKRKQLTKLLHELQEISLPIHGKKIIFLLIILCCMHISFSITTSISAFKYEVALYGYGHNLRDTYVYKLLIIIKILLYTLVFPTFLNIVALLYCLICLRIRELMKKLTRELTQCSTETFVILKRAEILKRKSSIDDILDVIQDIFSLPTFIIVVANLLNCFSVLSEYLDNYSMLLSGGISKMIECTLYTVNSLGCLIAVLWIAGDIPVEECKFKRTLQKKINTRLLFAGNSEKFKSEKLLLLKQDFVFTGLDILSYRRSSIFTLFGALMTYTVLIIKE